jgi:hypothetical protein
MLSSYEHDANVSDSGFAFPRRRLVSRDTATLNDIIEVLDDGLTFYQEAATRVERPDLRNLFERMARTKQSIAENLRTAVVAVDQGTLIPLAVPSASPALSLRALGLLAALSPIYLFKL